MFIHSVSMRKMEMYFVFFLFATLLSVRGEIVEVSNELKTKLLERHITHRPVLKLSDASEDIIKEVNELINKYDKNRLYCSNHSYCLILVKLEKKFSLTTADEMYTELKNVTSIEDNNAVEWANNMRKFATIMDFLLIEVKKDNIRSDQFFVALYHPAGYPDVILDDVVDEFSKIISCESFNIDLIVSLCNT